MFFLTLFQQTNASQWTVWECSATTRALVAQSCPTLCDPMDCSPPGSSVHGILQARILEWVAIALLQGIFLTQGSNPGLLHSRQILYHLSYPGKPYLFIRHRNSFCKGQGSLREGKEAGKTRHLKGQCKKERIITNI